MTEPSHNRIRVAHKKLDRTYQYDHVFGPFASQEEVFKSTVEPIVREMLQVLYSSLFFHSCVCFSTNAGLPFSSLVVEGLAPVFRCRPVITKSSIASWQLMVYALRPFCVPCVSPCAYLLSSHVEHTGFVDRVLVVSRATIDISKRASDLCENGCRGLCKVSIFGVIRNNSLRTVQTRAGCFASYPAPLMEEIWASEIGVKEAFFFRHL